MALAIHCSALLSVGGHLASEEEREKNTSKPPRPEYKVISEVVLGESASDRAA